MSAYIKLTDRAEESLSGYSPEGVKNIEDTDALQRFVKDNDWSIKHTVEIAHQLQERITESPEAVFGIY